MSTSFLIHATGLVALALNISGLMRSCDRSLRVSTGWASAIWALNNLLLGAHSAAALSVLSVGRQASATAVQSHPARTKAWSCGAFVIFTMLIAAFTWNGMTTVFTTAGSLIATYAMFYMGGAPLRFAMIAVAGLWMYNAVAYDSWWQMAANALAAGAAALGAWRTRQAR